MEKVLSDARNLISRQKEHVATADSLVAAAQSLYLRVDAMKQVSRRVDRNQCSSWVGERAGCKMNWA